MKRLAFIDSAHHKETGSSKYITDFLSPYFDIDIYWDKSKLGGPQADLAAIERGNYDSVLIFQTGINLNLYSQIACDSIIAVPNMIFVTSSVENFLPKNIKYLAMSKAQHKILSALGRNSAWFQYFPNPYDFNPYRDYSFLRGFYWCRSPGVSLNMINDLIADAEFVSLHIHDAAMPGVCSLVTQESYHTDIHVSSSKWLKDPKEYLKILAETNVFFAPRLFEFTPNAILEAMSLGMCVVAPDLPSTNEYIKSGENGLLYDPDDLAPLDFSDAESIGRNARKSVELGFDRWLEHRQELFEFLTGTPIDQWNWKEVLEPEFKLKSNLIKTISKASENQKKIGETIEGGKRLSSHENKSLLLTVVTVVRNSENTLERTIKSVLGQTFDDFEYIIIDGLSSDGTIEIIQQYETLLDYWLSEKDEGPYPAMSKAVNLARGDYIVFMNAGDWFASPRVLERLFSNISEKPDIVYGDHIWLNNGTPNFHKSLPFSAIERFLCKGKNATAHWYQGLPNHQSTFVKTKLLHKWPFDTKYRIAADYDFLFRMARKGASFMQVDLLISVYLSGGFSGQNEPLCHEEWKQVFSEYRNYNIDQYADRVSEHHYLVKCIPSPAMHVSEFFPDQRQTSIPSEFTERFAALAAVNECSRVYLTTPCLNAIDTIDQTISSVVSQCGSNYVLRYHIQDGGSTDGTIERLMDWDRMLSFSSPGKLSGKFQNVIFSYSSEPDSGMYEAITRGFDCMEVPYTAILSWINADDILFPGAIATMVKIFRKYPQVHWVTGHNCLISYQGEVIGYNDEAKPADYIRAGFCESQNWRFVQQEGTFFRKWLWHAAGGFNGNLKIAADWDLWRRFAESTELVHFPGPIAAFRLRRGQISGTEINKYMDEIDTVVPSAEREEAKKRLAVERGKDLKIASICFRNNRYSLEDKPLRDFRIPHPGRKLFNLLSRQNVEGLDSSLSTNSGLTAATSLICQKDTEMNYQQKENSHLLSVNGVNALQYAPNLKCVIFSGGWNSQEEDESGWWRWSTGKGFIHLASIYDGKAKLSFRIGSALPGNTIHLVINGKSLRAFEVDQGSKMIKTMQIKVKAGINILELSSRLTPVTSSKDYRQLCFRVGDISFTSPKFGFRRGRWTKAMELQKSLFYEQYYADQVTDITKLKMAPVIHYLLYGGWEGKDPNPMFSSNFYLSKYKDVYLSGMNPLLHYILHGWKEGRDPHPEFSTKRYLIDHINVKESGMNPLSHYLLHGIIEGRKIYPSNYSEKG